MLGSLRLAYRRFSVRSYLADLSYRTPERRLEDESGADLDRLSRLGLEEGWSARTTAGIVAGVRSARSGLAMDPDRRQRVGTVLARQEGEGVTALSWFGEFESGRLNTVGIDAFVLRYNYCNGVLASWIRRGRNVDPQVRPIFIALSAWALAGIEEATLDERLDELLGGLGRREPAAGGRLSAT